MSAEAVMAASAGAALFGLIRFETDAAAVSAPYVHERALVGLSMLVAVAGAFAFLELAGRVRAHRALAASLWVAASGAMLGACVWGTHFVGLIAFESPLVHGFAWGPTALSALCAVSTGVIAFLLAGPRPDWRRFALGGACVGVGAIVMHYLGMQGLRIEAALSYRPPYVAITSFGALAGCMAAFWLAYRLEATWARAVAAFPIGAVIAALHYTDMAATVIAPRPAFAAPAPALPEIWLAAGVAGAMGVLLAAALGAVGLDRRVSGAGALDIPAPLAREPAGGASEHVVVIPTPSRDSVATVVLAEKRAPPRP